MNVVCVQGSSPGLSLEWLGFGSRGWLELGHPYSRISCITRIISLR